MAPLCSWYEGAPNGLGTVWVLDPTRYAPLDDFIDHQPYDVAHEWLSAGV